MRNLLWLWFGICGLVSIFLAIIGFIFVIPWMTAYHAYYDRPSRYWPDKRMVATWRGGWWTWVWGNEEDGVTGAKWFRDKYGESDQTTIDWSAFRNFTGNFRFIPGVSIKGGPFKRWFNADKTRYFQIGYRPDKGWPVCSPGDVPAGGFDY